MENIKKVEKFVTPDGECWMIEVSVVVGLIAFTIMTTSNHEIRISSGDFYIDKNCVEDSKMLE